MVSLRQGGNEVLRIRKPRRLGPYLCPRCGNVQIDCDGYWNRMIYIPVSRVHLMKHKFNTTSKDHGSGLLLVTVGVFKEFLLHVTYIRTTDSNSEFRLMQSLHLGNHCKRASWLRFSSVTTLTPSS